MSERIAMKSPLTRWYAVWLRNARVWRRLAGPAFLGNIGEPLLYLFALGYGLGAFVGKVEGVDYITFLASGFVCASAMNTASFESIYSAYTRMAVQETWTAMLYTPLGVNDILIGEIAWAATKASISAIAILIVATALDAVAGWQALWALPIALLLGACFGAMGLIMTAISKSYDFFLYYFTLWLTPMLLFSGVFFPIDQIPAEMRWLIDVLPLAHGVALVRPLMLGEVPTSILLHLSVIALYGIVTFFIAARLVRRRLYR